MRYPTAFMSLGLPGVSAIPAELRAPFADRPATVYRICGIGFPSGGGLPSPRWWCM